jgi:hypothetical protein
VSQIKKYLPSEKKPTSIMGLSQIPKQSSTSINSNKVENSPARKSSLSRLTASVLDKVLGNSNAKNTGRAADEGSDRGSTSGAAANTQEGQPTLQKQNSTNRGSFFGNGSSGAGPIARRPPSSHKSGNSGGGGSVVTSLSDLERIERIMT